jgi:hypothetical protein
VLAPHRARLLAVLLAGCDSLPPPPPSPASPPPAPHVPSGSNPPARPSGPRATAAPAPSENTVLQVEVSGRVATPSGAPRGRLLVALMDGPCFQPGSHYLALTQPEPDGRYQMTAFPPVGTRLEACGVLVEPLRAGASFWGRAERGTMPVQGRGRMVYESTDVQLRRGPDVQVPATIRTRG